MGHDFCHLTFLTTILCTSYLQCVELRNEHTTLGTTVSPLLRAPFYISAAKECIYFAMVLFIIIDLGSNCLPYKSFFFLHEHLSN